MTSAASSSRLIGLAMTRKRLTRSSRRPASGWPRWSQRTARSGPLVSGALLVAWAEWADSTTFDRRSGYTATEVDNYLRAIRDTFLGVSEPPVRADNVRGKQFPSTDAGYDKTQVDAFLDAAGIRLAAMESTDRPTGPLASDAVLADWAEWADSTRFSTTAPRSQGYDTAEVDALREGLRDTFLGVRQPPVMSIDLRGKQFSTHRPGYYKTQVDAFLEKAAWRLAAMESTEAMEAMDWSPPPWAKPRLDKVSLIGLITAIPGFALVSIPLGIWGVIRTKNHQRRGRPLAVISFVVIGLWAIVGTVVGVMAGLSVTSTTDQTAAPAPSAPSTVPGENDKPIWPHCAVLIWPHPACCWSDARRCWRRLRVGTAPRLVGGVEPVRRCAGLDDVGVEGQPVDDGGCEAGVGEGGAPFGEGGVGRARDGGFLLACGDDLEQQFGAAGVEPDVADLVDLCGYPHRSTYADTATMPRRVAGSRCTRSASGSGCRHSYRLSRKASILSAGR